MNQVACYTHQLVQRIVHSSYIQIDLIHEDIWKKINPHKLKKFIYFDWLLAKPEKAPIQNLIRSQI